MATRKPSKARDFDYSNVGKAGRRTGITLAEGKLDEHGMEEIDGMFSSPEKSPVQTNGNVVNDTIVNSEDMETGGSSSIPEPADLISDRRAARNSFTLPPRSRSPVKTFMSGSPRRTPGLRSSPALHSDQFSSPTSQRANARRTLDFSKARPRVESPLKVAHTVRTSNKGKGRAVEPDEGVTEDFSDDGNHLLDGEEGEEDEGATFMEAPGDYHEGADVGGDEEPEDEEEEEEEAEEEAEPEEDVPPEETSPSVIANASRRGRKRKSASPEAGPSEVRVNAGDKSKSTGANPGAKPRGSKPKQQAQREAEDETEDPRPTKKARPGRAKAQGNVQLSTEQEKELDQVVDNYTKRNGPLDKNRSLAILRRESPSDSSVRHTRSGRVSVRPLAYWRNERVVYGDDNQDVEVGRRFPVSTIKEIIRTEEMNTGGLKKKTKRSSKKKSKQKNRDDLSDDEAGENAEPWETEGGGVFYGPVKVWDPETQAGTQEEEMMDIGYAPSAIQTHEVKDSTFRFAKILSTPFLGSGFVEMPPGAVKKQKNSKRMHMVFFVYHGRIQVDIAGLQFGAGKGCVFQVPRGNNYSFANDYEKAASIFFTQGCIPLDPEGNIDTTVTAPPLPDPATVQAEAEAEAQTSEAAAPKAKPAKKRGRPKQKQKQKS